MQGVDLVIKDIEGMHENIGDEMLTMEMTMRSMMRLLAVEDGLTSPLVLGVGAGCWRQTEGVAMRVLTQTEVRGTPPPEDVRFYQLQPLSTKQVQRAVGWAEQQRRELSDAEKERINTVCLRVGIPAHIQGYAYIRTAVGMVLLDAEAINSITKVLYPGVAGWHGTSATKVERSIRHAVYKVWKNGRMDMFNRLFGYEVCSPSERPTNGAFIALLVELCQKMG